VQTCIWPSWCHCHSLSLAPVKSRLVLPFWYWLTWVVPEKGPLSECVCVQNNRRRVLFVFIHLFTDTGQFSFYSQPKSHGAASIVEFMERAMAYSRNGQFLYFLRPNAPGLAPAPVQLLYPVSRLDSVPSLQHLCRFVIASRVRRDHIDFLPTPTSLKEYLKQTQYYAMTWLLWCT